MSQIEKRVESVERLLRGLASVGGATPRQEPPPPHEPDDDNDLFDQFDVQ